MKRRPLGSFGGCFLFVVMICLFFLGGVSLLNGCESPLRHVRSGKGLVDVFLVVLIGSALLFFAADSRK